MLTRWDPFREMVAMRRAVDRLIDNTASSDEWKHESDWGLPLDVVEEEDAYVVKASIPGIKPDQFEITYNKGMLTIKGEIKDESESNTGQYHLRERRYGSFSRTISLPNTVNYDTIQANYEDGVLTLKMPKSEEVKPKRIPIQVGDGRKVIESQNN